MIRRLLIILVAMAAVAGPATARDAGDAYRPIRAGEPLTIRPDKAYILLRIGLRGTTQDPVLLREPDAAETAAYEDARAAAFARAGSKGDIGQFVFDHRGEPNLFLVQHGKSFVGDKSEAVVLAEVKPGNYVLYGTGFGGFLFQCLCLGTVGFTVEPGVITDLGTYLSDKASTPSVYPELAAETNIGPTARMDYLLFAAGLVPARSGEALPAGIDPARVRPAKLRTVGPFVDPNVLHINRLAAIPGILAYDGGRVIDVASGQERPPR